MQFLLALFLCIMKRLNGKVRLSLTFRIELKLKVNLQKKCDIYNTYLPLQLHEWMGRVNRWQKISKYKVGGWGGWVCPCDYCVTPVPIGLGFCFWTGLGLVLGLGGLDLGLGLDNIFLQGPVREVITTRAITHRAWIPDIRKLTSWQTADFK